MTTKIKTFFLNFSVIFFIAGITSFTAYNWKAMNNFQKLALPSSLIVLGFIFYFLMKKENYKNLAIFFTCFMVGTLFAVFGQTYQTGADTWILFRNWAIFLIIPVIFSKFYSVFFQFIIVLCLMTFFGLGLYYNGSCSFFIATLIPASVITIYPFVVEKFKLNFNNFFYNSLTIPFYIFFNLAGVSLIFGNDPYYDRTFEFLEKILVISYPLITILIFLVAFKKYKKYVILPFTIITAGLTVWAFLADTLLFHFYTELTGFFLLSLLIFIATFVVFIKNLPSVENDFIKKLFKSLSNFLKFSIFLSGLGLLVAIIFVTNPSKYSFLFLGIVVIAISCYLPKILKYREDNLDLISFLLGLSSLIYFFAIIFEENIEPVHLAFFAIVVFDIFYFTKKNKAMDLLFAPAHYLFILTLMEENYNFPFYNLYINTNLLSIVAILFLALQLIFSQKIEASEYKDRINRIFYGNNMSLLLFFMFFNNSSVLTFSFYEKADTISKNIEHIIKSRTALIIINSMYIIYSSFKNKKSIINSNNRVSNMTITIALILIIQCFAWKILDVNFIILLILLYTYKAYKWTTLLLNIALCYQIFTYYYQLYHITLLQKAYYMLYMSLALLFAYFIMKVFIKEGVSNE
ncbi:DUF2157 domain-containing protein [Fusobacterium russii]|uniref:DUF2157 domain-containing protein n=1 Tax=Fusobacterium russii TaxID=854 RepID=UPI00039C3E43|nr:DUF2157 domain-containing protein [Fusobacterium russii]